MSPGATEHLARALMSCSAPPGGTLHDRGPVAVVAPGHHRVTELDLDPRRSRDQSPQPSQAARSSRSAPAQVAAEPVLFLDQHDPERTGPRGGHHSGQGQPPPATSTSGWAWRLSTTVPAAVHGYVPGVREPLRRALVQRPEPLRLDESLVVEAGAEEPQASWLTALTSKPVRARCSGSARPGRVRPAGAPAHVQLIADLEEAARVVVARGEQAARPVILVAAQERRRPERRQRRRDGVPVECQGRSVRSSGR